MLGTWVAQSEALISTHARHCLGIIMGSTYSIDGVKVFRNGGTLYDL
jgi:hypothetical protein